MSVSAQKVTEKFIANKSRNRIAEKNYASAEWLFNLIVNLILPFGAPVAVIFVLP